MPSAGSIIPWRARRRTGKDGSSARTAVVVGKRLGEIVPAHIAGILSSPVHGQVYAVVGHTVLAKW